MLAVAHIIRTPLCDCYFSPTSAIECCFPSLPPPWLVWMSQLHLVAPPPSLLSMPLSSMTDTTRTVPNMLSFNESTWSQRTIVANALVLIRVVEWCPPIPGELEIGRVQPRSVALPWLSAPEREMT